MSQIVRSEVIQDGIGADGWSILFRQRGKCVQMVIDGNEDSSIDRYSGSDIDFMIREHDPLPGRSNFGQY